MATTQTDEDAVKHEFDVWDQENKAKRLGEKKTKNNVSMALKGTGEDTAWSQDLDAALKGLFQNS